MTTPPNSLQPRLPSAVGVSIDADSPGRKGVLVSFERTPTDDELRALHELLAQRHSTESSERDVALEEADQACRQVAWELANEGDTEQEEGAKKCRLAIQDMIGKSQPAPVSTEKLTGEHRLALFGAISFCQQREANFPMLPLWEILQTIPFKADPPASVEAHADAPMVSALNRILDGARTQGAHTGMSWGQVEKICLDALNGCAAPLPDQAAGEGEDGLTDAQRAKRHAIMIHDFPRLQQFHSKHALGPMMAPSCLCCGQMTSPQFGEPHAQDVAIQHAELPGIVICRQCRDRASAPVAAGWQPIETAPKDGTLILLGREEDLEDDRAAISTPGRWHEEDHDGPDNMGHDAGFMDDEYQQFSWGRSFGNPDYMSKGFQPTQWQPIPAPPTESLKGDA